MDFAGGVQMVVALCNIGALGLGALYLRGKLDAKAEVSSQDGQKGASTAQAALLLATATEAQLEQHFDECARRDAMLERRFSGVGDLINTMANRAGLRIDALETNIEHRFDNLQGQINALARGEAGAFREIIKPPSRKR
jgi:hypothetical protein